MTAHLLIALGHYDLEGEAEILFADRYRFLIHHFLDVNLHNQKLKKLIQISHLILRGLLDFFLWLLGGFLLFFFLWLGRLLVLISGLDHYGAEF